MISKRKMIVGLVFTCVFSVVIFWMLTFAVPTGAANTQETVTEEMTEQKTNVTQNMEMDKEEETIIVNEPDEWKVQFCGIER